jgi:hypothetical protein
MTTQSSRRTLLGGLAAVPVAMLTSRAALAGPNYAAIRVVRAVAGVPASPTITVPAGYSLLPGTNYQVASRAEFTSFVQGPLNNAGITVSVRWPGQQIAAVVAGDRRLALHVDPADPERVSVTLPVFRTSAVADSPTIQVWSFLRRVPTGIEWRVEHNDPDRAVGYWAGVPWPSGETRAVVSYLSACEAILSDSGLAAEASRRGHYFSLEGFETNNMPHLDNPPHWHLSYYPGATTGATPATVPHFWVDTRGRTFYNGQDVTGKPRGQYHAGDPAPIYDGQGTLIVTTTIRADGGLDIIPPAGPTYSITSATGDFTDGIQVLRAGLPWRTVRTIDDYHAGILLLDVRGLGHDPIRERRQVTYDALTGAVQSTRYL